MKQISGKNPAKLLEKNGWTLTRKSGSHQTYKKQNIKEMITIPIHGNKSIKPGMLKQVLKIARISEDEL